MNRFRYTVVIAPRHDSRGVTCNDLFDTRQAAQECMESLAGLYLAENDYTADEIDDYMAADNIDTEEYFFSVASIVYDDKG